MTPQQIDEIRTALDEVDDVDHGMVGVEGRYADTYSGTSGRDNMLADLSTLLAEVERLTAERGADADHLVGAMRVLREENDELRSQATDHSNAAQILHGALREVEQQRDEARAEVATLDRGMNNLDRENERLRGQLDRVREYLLMGDRITFGQWRAAIDLIKEATDAE